MYIFMYHINIQYHSCLETHVIIYDMHVYMSFVYIYIITYYYVGVYIYMHHFVTVCVSIHIYSGTIS